MNYQELFKFCKNNRQSEILKAIIDCGGKIQAARYLGVDIRTIQRTCKRIESAAGLDNGKQEDNKQKDEIEFNGTKQHPRHRRGKLNGKRFLFTSAQNNTLPNNEVLDTMIRFCELNNAQLVIGGFSYSKKGLQLTEKGGIENYDPRLRKYIVNEQMKVCDGLIWCGELNVLPTATYPSGQFKSYCGSDSLILPHAKSQMEPVETEPDMPAKQVFSTGAVTQLNYIQKSAGQKAEWDHIFGALYVEIDKYGDWHARDLNFESETGIVYDLGVLYDQKRAYIIDDAVDVISLPDVHIDKLDQRQLKPYYRMLKDLNPAIVTVNDVHDHGRRNHHNTKDIYGNFRLHVIGKECVREEVGKTVSLLKSLRKLVRKEVLVVESNHDLALQKWLIEQDYKKDNVNAEFFLELQLANYKFIRQNPDESLQTFKKACEICNGGREIKGIKFLKSEEVYRINGVVHSRHMHDGPGGARGNIRNYSKLGEKYTCGHNHKGGRIGGVYVNGVIMTPSQSGYAKGQSAWSEAFTIQYKNGKRQQCFMKNGKYHA